MIADTREFGTCLGTQFFKFSECTSQHDLANRAADCLADSGILSQIRTIADKLIDAFGQSPNCGGGSLVRFYSIWILLLNR